MGVTSNRRNISGKGRLLMLTGVTSSKVGSVLEQALSAASLREQLLANNIANIDTPGFKRSDIDFNAALRQALAEAGGATNPYGIIGRRTKLRHLEIPHGSWEEKIPIRRESWLIQRNDENNVSIEVENASRDQNQILYSAAAQLYGDRMKWLSAVLDSRR